MQAATLVPSAPMARMVGVDVVVLEMAAWGWGLFMDLLQGCAQACFQSVALAQHRDEAGLG